VTWHHPIGGEVTGYYPYPLRIGWARWAQAGYGDSDNGICPRCRHSHQLWAGGILSIESLITSRNMARAGRLRDKVSPLTWLDFLEAGYVVCYQNHFLLTCSFNEMDRALKAIANCREHLAHMTKHHWTRAPLLYHMSNCFWTFSYLFNSFSHVSSCFMNLITHILLCPITHKLWHSYTIGRLITGAQVQRLLWIVLMLTYLDYPQ
jgi:hypothetical protein